MGWQMSATQKIRTGAALLMVFLLVIATNMMDSSHFNIVKQSLITVYEDRLVAKAHLYKISRQLQMKKDALQYESLSEIATINTSANDSIQVLVNKFTKTRLTEKESYYLESLKNNLKRLSQYEAKLNQGTLINQEVPTIDEVDRFYTPIFNDLDELSKIQLIEGEKQVNQSNRAIGTSDLISRIEIGVLILIGILIQLLIFLKPVK